MDVVSRWSRQRWLLLAARLVQVKLIALGKMLVLEASASMPTDVTFKVPIHRLRMFRKQVAELLGLPATEEFNSSWLLFRDSMVEALQLTECHCALEGKEEIEVQVLRLASLCSLAFAWSHLWN